MTELESRAWIAFAAASLAGVSVDGEDTFRKWDEKTCALTARDVALQADALLEELRNLIVRWKTWRKP